MVAQSGPGGGFKQILLDGPAKAPTLGFDEIGAAFAAIIRESQAQFAIGIFGGWGSGKTTLMTAIKSALPQDSVVAVDFNAWRFEREPLLLIPLLDTIRAALVRWSEPRDVRAREKARSVATRVGRVIRALATGLSAEVGLPGAAKVSYNIGTALDALSPPEEPEVAQSLYVAAFTELKRVFDEFSAGGATRVVVFVDDLDRCLPGNALDVLESMKLFFDLPGFVFVVGLDEDVVERAIRVKFAGLDEGAGSGSQSHVSRASQHLAREYVKKIFQLPYSLPRMMPQQLDDLLRSIYVATEHDRAQFDELRQKVLPYLRYIAVDRQVNPREVKRFINAYTLQTLIRPALDTDTVLALQTLAFRYDWGAFYEAILPDSQLFVSILRRYRQDQGRDLFAFADLSPDFEVLPSSLASYLRSPLALPLTSHSSLDSFLSSLESARGRRSWELDAYTSVGRLRREIRRALGQVPLVGQGPISDSAIKSAIKAVSETAAEVLQEISGLPLPTTLTNDLRVIESLVSAISKPTGAVFNADELRDELTRLQTCVDNFQAELQVLRNDSILKS